MFRNAGLILAELLVLYCLHYVTPFILFCFQDTSQALLAAASGGHGAIVTILLLAKADKNFADKVRYSYCTSAAYLRIVMDATCDSARILF